MCFLLNTKSLKSQDSGIGTGLQYPPSLFHCCYLDGKYLKNKVDVSVYSLFLSFSLQFL